VKIKLPTLYHHKPSGQGRITYQGQNVYFGNWHDPETEKRYKRWCAELLVDDGLPVQDAEAVTINVLAAHYLTYCSQYYGPDSAECGNVKRAVQTVLELYGATPANEFTPKNLKAVRAMLLEQTKPKPLSRSTINKYTRLARRMFKWGASEGIIEYNVYAALGTVEGLRKGRTKARETRTIEPVPEQDLQSVLKIAPRILRDMITLQSLSGMRPGEICGLRRRNIDTSREVWTVEITDHKMAHLEDARPRFAAIGPRGQKILKRYLLRPDSAYLFNPREAIKQKAEQAPTHRRRGQKITPRKTGRKVQDHYTTSSYRKAITRLCQEAKIKPWGPNSLRKYAATKVREKYGLDAAQAVLGHSSADTSEIYAKVNQAKVIEIAKELG